MKLVFATAAALLLAAACASGETQIKNNGGPRPPQGPGPAGTDFGYWNRDAEGAVDAQFRDFILARYKAGDEEKARATLVKDGFECKDVPPRTDNKPGPSLSCSRLYKLYDDVSAWSVEFWPGDKFPHARYTRTHIRDRMQTYDDQKHH